MFNRSNLFGGRDGSPQPPPRDQHGRYQNVPQNQGYGTPPPPPQRGGNDYGMNQNAGYSDNPYGGGPPSYSNNNPNARNPGLPPRSSSAQQYPPGRGSSGGVMYLTPTKSPDNSFTFRNLAAVSTADFPSARDGAFLLINGMYVLSARSYDRLERGLIGLSEPQRSWMGLAMTDQPSVEVYNEAGHGLASADIEVGFASQKKTIETPYDQDELMKAVTTVSFPILLRETPD